MTHGHLTSIVLTLILFFIALTLQKKGRNIKVLHIILSLMYLLIILTGGMLFIATTMYVVKAVLGVLTIVLFEVILYFNGKGEKMAGLWAIFFIIVIMTVYLGLKLPLGLHLFN